MKQRTMVDDLSKKSPKDFWTFINNARKGNGETKNVVEQNDCVHY